MSRHKLRFADDESSPELPPKKRKRKQRPPEHYNSTSEGASDATPSGGDTPQADAAFSPTTDYLKVEKLEQKSARHHERMESAQKSLPTKKKLSRKRIYDEEKSRAKTKLTFEAQPIPIHEAKWNQPRKKTAARMVQRTATTQVVNQIHAKIREVENENVGVKAAHQAELKAESAYSGTKRAVTSVYRFHRNRPYRKASRLEVKSLKTEGKLSYHRALRDNPKLGSNPVSRMFQKRAIKRQYAAAIRNAKKSGKVANKSVGIVSKMGRLATGIIRRNPIALLKAAILGVVILLLMAMLSMCMSMFSGGSVFVGAVTYLANYEDIDDASILYTELETDLQVYLRNIESNHPGFHEYRYDVGMIDHNPFELMAYLTAAYGEFTFAEIEPVLRALFAEQYQLTLTPEVKIRTCTETRMDAEGNTYTVEVEYEWHILNVTLTSRPLTLILMGRMDSDERQHFNVLMASRGARQLVGNPFGFNWLPHMSSRYGYRIHPIHGDKQFHAGIDIALPTGTEILAGFDGTVTNVGYDAGGYGNFVVIDDGAGIQALYAHCHTVLVSRGQTVQYGQVIATVGSTGASTGPHLHMEVFRNGRRLNPLFFVVTGSDGSFGGLQYGDARPLTAEEFAILYAEARSHLGKPYVFGANGPNAFDCSSFVAWVYRHSGIYPLARTTAQGIFNQSIIIPPTHAAPGDIVFFHSTYSTTNFITHVGVYLGDGMMIHAGRHVNITSVNTPFWQAHLVGWGRLSW